MKPSNIIILILVILGIAVFILPTRQADSPKSNHAPQQRKIRDIGVAMVYFEDTYHRFPRDLGELATYIRLKKPDPNISTSDFSFTHPDGHSEPWILLPVIDGKERLAASPEFNWADETRQIVLSKNGNQEILRKKTEPNQAPETTTMAVTPAASHPSRQP